MIDIDALSLKVTADQNSYCYSFEAEIKRPEDFHLLNPGKEINLVFYGTTYKVIIDERNRSQVFNEKHYSIQGRAITAKLGEGWGETITKSWDGVMVSSVVQELCSDVGLTSLYLASDWLIPRGVLSVDNEYRINVLYKIADACGAILQTLPNGTLVVRKKYDTPPPNIHDANIIPDIILGVQNDIISLSENYEVKPKYNEVVVMDMNEDSESYSIFVIEEIESTGVCVLGVQVFPFRDYIEMLTSSNSVNIIYEEKVIEQIDDEVVEIVMGEGSTSKPVKNILSSQFVDNDLVHFNIVGNKVTTEVKENSLILLTYETEYHKFRVRTTNIDMPFQVYVEGD
jgi:hypothetical protein